MARGPQPLWAAVPVAGPRALPRAARRRRSSTSSTTSPACWPREARVPRTEALLAELLPSVAGLHELADDGPRALSRPPARTARRSCAAGGGRCSPQAPARRGRRPRRRRVALGRGGAGDRRPRCWPATASCSPPPTRPWARASPRRSAAPGLPDDLVQVVAPGDDLDGCDLVVRGRGARGAKCAMLVLDGAPVDRVVAGALWAAYARGGHGTASVGRIVCVPEAVANAARARSTQARARLRVGDPQDPATEVGPLLSAEQAAGRRGARRRRRAGGRHPHVRRPPRGRPLLPGAAARRAAAGAHPARAGAGARAVRRRGRLRVRGDRARGGRRPVRLRVGGRPGARRARGTHARRRAHLGQRARRGRARGARPDRAADLAASARLALHPPAQRPLAALRPDARAGLGDRGPTALRPRVERLDIIRRGGPAFARVAGRMARETLRR